MRRREFIGLAGGAAAWAIGARAQSNKIPRVGYFWPGFSNPNSGLAGFRQGLADRGFVLGQNLVLEERYAEGDLGRTPALLAELLALGVDVLVTGDYALILAHKMTTTVPVVGVAADFIGVRLAAGLSRPGGNVTGMSLLSADFSPKWLEYLKAAVPKLRRVAFLGGDTGPVQAEKIRLDDVASRDGVTLTQLDLWLNLEPSLGALTGANFDGLIVSDDLMAEPLLPRIVALAAENRLPAIYGFSTAVSQGGLMSYSADAFEIWRRLAGPVARILAGAKPGDIPIEQTTEIKLAINLKTAKALDVEIPVNLLAAAQEVIE
jgi:putative ABC transport system substrate-binding protein